MHHSEKNTIPGYVKYGSLEGDVMFLNRGNSKDELYEVGRQKLIAAEVER